MSEGYDPGDKKPWKLSEFHAHRKAEDQRFLLALAQPILGVVVEVNGVTVPPAEVGRIMQTLVDQ